MRLRFTAFAFCFLFFCPGPTNAQVKGIITTIAGTGDTSGYSGDGGLATKAKFNGPAGIIIDKYGNIYIADQYNNVVRKINGSTGIITTLAGTGIAGYSGDGGLAVNAQLREPSSIKLFGGADTGSLYIADVANNVIRKLKLATGVITTVAGNGYKAGVGGGFSGDSGLATNAEFYTPQDVALDGSGNLYISDSYNDRIRKVDATTGIITTIAGTGSMGTTGDGGLASLAELNRPGGLNIDNVGNLYVGGITPEIRKIDHSTGIINDFIGTGVLGYSGDGGPATSAKIERADEVVFDAAGNIYFADGNRVRYVNISSGVISTVAGTGAVGYSGDGGLATLATFKSIAGVALDPSGNLYIVDNGNQVIRKITNGTAVNNLNMEAEIRLYPNPTTGVIYMTLPPVMKSVAVSIYNVVGQQVVNTVCDNNRTSINISDQPAGVYYVRIALGDDVVVRKVVKE